MRSRVAFLLFCSAASLALVLDAAACSSSTAVVDSLANVEGGPASGDDAAGDSAPVDAATADTYIPPGSPSRIYAHTMDTLYLFEPLTNDLKRIGKFSCLDSTDINDVVVDLAVDRTNTMYATTFTRFLSVDPQTANCTEIHKVAGGEENYPNALSFVPAGTVDPTREALVGYAPPSGSSDSTDYVRIDVTTGAVTVIGTLNDPESAVTYYKSSGDLVSLVQDSNRTYLTVKIQADAGITTDLFAEVDPSSGTLKRIIGDTLQTDIFGLGYWAGKAYGFSDNGKISAIDVATGSATVVKTLTSADGGTTPWYGAGVTTEAPVTP